MKKQSTRARKTAKAKTAPRHVPRVRKSKANPSRHLAKTRRSLAVAPAAVAERKPPVAKPLPFEVPAILLEGDEPVAVKTPPASQQLAPARTPGVGAAAILNGEDLPEAYGSGRLLLAARDPHCLYAHWDLSSEQRRSYNQLSEHRHLLVRLHAGSAEGEIVQELHVHPESRCWFIHVDRPGVAYVAELGYYQIDHQWRTVSLSDPVVTPGQSSAPPLPLKFATVPTPFTPPAKPGTLAAVPGTAALEKPSRQGSRPYPDRPTSPPQAPQPTQDPSSFPSPAPSGSPGPVPAEPFTDLERHGTIHTPALPVSELPPGSQQILRELTAWTDVASEWINSAEVAALVRREAEAETFVPPPAGGEVPPVAGAAGGPAPGPEGPFGISSPQGREAEGPRGFWFNVNADLVIHGATEPGSTLTLGGRVIQLRPDGTFTCRFALPDGWCQLPVTATSADGETRQAVLSFSRRTAYSGEVQAQPQDPGLQPPPDHVT